MPAIRRAAEGIFIGLARLVESCMDLFSDAGSTPAASTKVIAGRTQDDRVYALATGFVLVSKIASKP